MWIKIIIRYYTIAYNLLWMKGSTYVILTNITSEDFSFYCDSRGKILKNSLHQVLCISAEHSLKETSPYCFPQVGKC